jgi:D-alanine-D-alanine ligase
MSGTQKTRVLVLFGGRSSEHQVSCLSARSVVASLERDPYVVTCVGITRDGRWTLLDRVPEGVDGSLPSVPDDGDTVTLVQTRKGPRLVRFRDDFTGEELGPVDVCFPVLHGPYGEDGTIQGLLASFGVPYVGADVASSAIGIDKRQMKHVFSARGLPQTPYVPVARAAWEDDADDVIAGIEAALPYPLFTKPSRQGSSIGITRAPDRAALLAGIEEALGYDRHVLVEQAVDDVRELECGVLGNAVVEVAGPGETVHSGAFYDFEAKYLAPVELRCPAEVDPEIRRRCRDYAREAYLAIGARGMARVDFFYAESTGTLLVNEINTIPGLTPASMFPPVWAAEGLDFPALLDRLFALAFEAAAIDGRYAP